MRHCRHPHPTTFPYFHWTLVQCARKGRTVHWGPPQGALSGGVASDPRGRACIPLRAIAIAMGLKSQLARISHHLRYLSFAAGRPLELGGQPFRMKGYFPNRFYAGSSFEPHLSRVIARLLTDRPGAFIDVGTNFGQTLVQLLATHPGRQYVGFEPQVSCCFYIEQFLRTNGIESAQVIPVGLGESSGFLTLNSNRDGDEMASMDSEFFGTAGSARYSRLLPVVRGDEALERLGVDDIAIVKIDVEGAELNVMRGLEATIRNKAPALLFEVLPAFEGKKERRMLEHRLASLRRARADAIFEFLSGLGYSILQIDSQGELQEIDSFSLNDPASYVSRDYAALQRRRPMAGEGGVRAALDLFHGARRDKTSA